MTDSAPPSRSRPSTAALLCARWLLAVAVLGSALALGSLHTTVLAVVTSVLALAAFLAWWNAEPIRARPAATVLLVTGIALTAYTALQSVPMPIAWLAVLSPASAEVWTRALSPLHEPGPSWATLSLDPIATRVQVLRGVAYLCAFLAAVRIAHKREGVAFLERALVVSVVVMAVVAVLHPAFGAQKVFGAYKPVNESAFSPTHLAPLLNVNHLMGYMNLGVCVALGMAISPNPAFPRLISAVIVLLLTAVSLWIGSRGGFGALVLGILVTVALTRAAGRPDRAASIGNLLTGLLALAGIGIAVLASSDEAWADLSGTDLSKLQLIRQAFRMVPKFPAFGVGRGAFESVFPAFREGTGYWVFSHPENLPAQWFVEWGAPVAIAAFAACAYALRPANVLARSRPPVGVWAAMACLTVQNLVDFSFEVPGVMLALAVCAAIVVGGSAGAVAPLRVEAWSQRPSALASSIVAVGVGGIWLALQGVSHELNTQQLALRDKALDPSLTSADFRDQARQAMLAHPAEPYLPFAGALHAARTRDESLIPWLGRAFERSPVFGRAHLLLARTLVVRSPSQARLEYRLACEQDRELLSYVATESQRLIGNYDEAMEVVPDLPQGIALIESLVTGIGDRLPATRVMLDAELLRRAPTALEPSVRAARRVLADLRAGEASPWCTDDRRRCLDNGLNLTKRIIEKSSGVCLGHALQAEMRIELDDTKLALDELEKAADGVGDRVRCLQTLASFASSAHDNPRVTATLDKLSRAGCSTDLECAEGLIFVASAEEGRGNLRLALSSYEKAYERAPEREDSLLAAARISSSLDLHAAALDAYTRLQHRHPEDPRWPAAILVERNASLAQGQAH